MAFPPPALAAGKGTGKKDVNTVAIDNFDVKCTPSTKTVSVDLTVRNDGDGDRTFSIVVRVKTGETANHASDPQEFDFGAVPIALGKSVVLHDSKTVNTILGGGVARVFIHPSTQTLKNEK